MGQREVSGSRGPQRGRRSLVLAAAVCGLVAWAPRELSAQGASYYVATNGSDGTGTGSSASPWATIEFAVNQVPDGSLILLKPGTYTGRMRIDGGAPGRVFAQGITIRSEVPYQARLRNNDTVIVVFYGKGITLEGFDIAHSGPGSAALVVQIQDLRGVESGCGDGDCVGRITLRNNVLHDSFNNDIVKLNNGADDVTVEGNLFYNQGPGAISGDEHMDINSVTDVVVQDNVFFNDFAASGRTNLNDTSSFIVVKDSNAGDDSNLGAQRITIRRNVFLNWEGSNGDNFVLLGEDGQPFYEANDITIENNLMLGNTTNEMRAPLGVKGCSNVTFRNNTVAGDFPSLAFAFRLNQEPGNLPNQNIRFFNNVWSDPTGTMGDFSDTPIGETGSFTLSRNLYWNGGSAVPEDQTNDLINPTDDASGLVADPLLPGQAGIVAPAWNSGTAQFADGSRSIREVFERLVALYAVPAAGSPAVDAALLAETPDTDILGTPRKLGGAPPDIGAYEAGPGYALRFFGNGSADIDRVKVRVDDPANSLPGPAADVGAVDFTIELWMRALASENTAAAVSCGDNINWISGNIVVDRDRYNQDRKFGLSIAGGVFVFGVSGAGTGDHTICGTTSVLDNSWHHVAVQRRRSDGRMWLFVDGSLEAEEDGPGGDVSYPDNGVPGDFCGGPCTNSDPFLVFAAEKHDAGPAYPSFSGTLDEVRLSSSLRYTSNFTRPRSPFLTDASTVALYHFNEGSGDAVGDTSAAVGGPSPGVRRFGGSPEGPLWLASDAPIAGGGGPFVTVAFASPFGTAGEGALSASATVTLTTSNGEVTEAPVTVQYATSDGTAQAGSDYVALTGSVSFPAGTANGATDSISVLLSDDGTNEADETFTLVLSSPAGAFVGSPQAHTFTILDDDPPPELSINGATVTEGSSGTKAATFTVTLSVASGQTVAVGYTTADGTAVAPADYVSTSGTLAFPAGTTARTLTVVVRGDTVAELDETFSVLLSGAVNATIDVGEGTGTIQNDDVPGTLQFGSAAYTVSEGSTSTTITVKRTGGTASGVTVAYATSDGTAVAGSDYTPKSGALSFGLGVASVSFTVPIFPDTAIEGSETVLLQLSSPGAGASLGAQDTAVLTITDNETGGAFRFGAATYSRAESYPTATITVVRTGGTGGPVTVGYAMSDGTAMTGQDYTATTGLLTFLAGQTSKAFTVPITNDTLDEPSETVNLGLLNPAGGATLGTPIASTLTITDNDVGGVLQFGVAAYTYDEGVGLATITVTRSGGSASGVTVDFATSDGSAVAGQDYTATSGTLTFAANDLSETFTVPIADDGIADEGAETVNLTLTSPMGGATLGARKTTVLTVGDNESGIVVFFGNPVYSVSEAVSSALITIKRSGPTSSPLTVDYTTSNGSAVAGQDYTTRSGTLSFGVGISTRTLSVPITPDTLDESDETVSLALSNPSAGVLGTQGTAMLTIVDNDAGGTLQFKMSGYTVSEGTVLATVTVSRTGGSASGVTVSFATSDGTALAGQDYATTSGTLTFAAGQTSKTFTIPITLDTLDETNETVSLSLSNAGGGATLGVLVGATLTITDNDTGGAVQFSLSSYTVAEGGLATVVVTRSGGTASNIRVDFGASDWTATLGGGDYTATSGTLTFAAGDLSETFTVQTGPNGLDEGNETVNLTLSNPAGGATLGTRSTAALTITDSPATTLVYFASPNVSVIEGGLATVTVMRSGPLTGTSTVLYQTSDGTATVLAGDYTSKSGTLSFGAGVSKLTFTVVTKSDTLVEGPETVGLTLSSPTGATLGTQDTATLTIKDNDLGGVIKFSVASYSRAESYATATITVVRTGGTASGVTVGFATSDGTAMTGQDYATTSGTLTFAAGQTSKTFTVQITNDSLDETNETVTLTLSNPLGGASLGTPNPATFTITDDDTAGTVQLGAASYSVGEGGVTATITVSRTGGTASGVTVSYATSNGTATDGSDYTAPSGTLTFAASQTTQTFSVTILQDGDVEGNETVNLTLSAPGGAAVLGPRNAAVLFIVDDE